MSDNCVLIETLKQMLSAMIPSNVDDNKALENSESVLERAKRRCKAPAAKPVSAKNIGVSVFLQGKKCALLKNKIRVPFETFKAVTHGFKHYSNSIEDTLKMMKIVLDDSSKIDITLWSGENIASTVIKNIKIFILPNTNQKIVEIELIDEHFNILENEFCAIFVI